MPATLPSHATDQYEELGNELVHLARLALAGREQDVQQYIHRLARRHARSELALGRKLVELLREAPKRDTPLRTASGAPAPVDMDSRLPLVRLDTEGLDVEPILLPVVADQLETLRNERQHVDRLTAAGLRPSRTGLFVGPPGVGKTLAARWLGRELNLPLLVLDLSAVMSSFLGRTGVNVRRVLDYAKTSPCILLLDELDAVAKRRDDASEVGELKRLVTVLLQEIDDWPSTSLLIAATNHPDLLDPAVWRRFDHVVEFPLPDKGAIMGAIQQLLSTHPQDELLVTVLSETLIGSSFSEIERVVNDARRKSVIEDVPLQLKLEDFLTSRISGLPVTKRIDIAVNLVKKRGMSQRRANQFTGVSRDTLRKHLIEP